jgi:3-hydroxyisobutyrate dehydrogenase-like beta-hydroxyacid dehydrogenase
MSPLLCQELAEAAKGLGVDLVDAGMTGSAEAAATGTLRLLVGGEKDVVDRIAAELDAIAAEVVHMGPVGSGMAGKILNNFVVLGNCEILREACTTADRIGIDPTRLIEILSRTTARSWATEHWDQLRVIVEPSEASDFIMSRKDIGLAAALAEELGVDTPVMRRVRERQERLAGLFGV